MFSLLFTKPWYTPSGATLSGHKISRTQHKGLAQKRRGRHLDIFPIRFNLFFKVSIMYKT